MSFYPNEHYRYSFKNGMTGWDVQTIQIALNHGPTEPHLVEDGVFGPLTEAAVKKLQGFLSITADGIVGPETQGKLCIYECKAAEAHTTPKGLVTGICLGESSGIIPTTSSLYPSHTRDYGPLQDNKLDPNYVGGATPEQLKEAFNVRWESGKVAREVAERKKVLLGQPGAKTEQRAWELAVLYYNWPAAAKEIAAGHEATWEYEEYPNGPKYKLSDPAPWILKIELSGVTTGAQWCHFYIQSKTVYVTSWTVS